MEHIQKFMEPKKPSIEEARAKLAAIRKVTQEKTHHATTNDVQNSTALEIIAPDSVRAAIDEAYDVIEKHMLASIPWPEVHKKPKIKLNEWPECLRMMQILQRHHKSKANAKHVICRLNRKWTAAIKTMIKSTNEHYSQRVCYNRSATVT